MKFQVVEEVLKRDFFLIYREEEYSFDIEPHNKYGFTSILVNDLQLEVDEEGRIIYVWGLCPIIKPITTNKFPEFSQVKSLFVSITEPLIPGISHRVNKEKRWPIFINREKEWICIGDPNISSKKNIEFSPGSIGTIANNELIAIWLKPNNFPFTATTK